MDDDLENGPTPRSQSQSRSSVNLNDPRRYSGIFPQDNHAINLSWSNLKYTVTKGRGKKKKDLNILRGVSGEIGPGQMIAIMGPSGCGKTTLLNILAGRIGPGQLSGQVLVNRQKRPDDWRRLVGYVEQDDVMYRTLTVGETVEFAARMRLPRGTSEEEKQDRATRIIHSLGLDGVKDTWIGDPLHRGISGGERKRCSIAIELVADTRVLFLDEPTSGLDAFTAYYIVENIRDKVARLGNRTVLMTIHQPRANILGMFDKILLLAQGKAVFFGDLEDCLQHFTSLGYPCPEMENPADFFLDLISVDARSEEARVESQTRVDKFIAAWDTKNGTNLSEDYANIPRMNESSGPKRPNPWGLEFTWLILRAFKIQLRDYPTILGLIAQTLIIALLLSFVFFQLDNDFAGVQNRIGLLFFIPIDITFTMVMPLIPIFALDRAVIRRERYAATYRVSAFYLAEFISLLPLRLVLSTVFSFIVYYITGLRTDSFTYFLVFLLLVLLVTLTAICLGIAIGAAVPSVEIGQIVGPLMIVVFLIFGGNLANADSVTWILRWIQYTSLIFYTYQGLVQNELSGLSVGTRLGDAFLEDYSLDQIPWYYDVIGLVGLAAVFLVVGYVALRFTTKPTIRLI